MKATRRVFLGALGAAAGACGADPPMMPERTVVLTFDDAVKSHRTFVAPYLKELGFRATFFITHRWMPDQEHFLTWEEVAEIHALGFAIGNHSWTHANFGSPREAARLAGELALVENALKKVGVPRPVSFAWCGNGFGPEALRILQAHGIHFARRGMQPEIPYGHIAIGPAFDPRRHHRLLIPTTGDAYPDWNLAHVEQVLESSRKGTVPVLQFHGIPDVAHPWVHTPPERFRQYMEFLKLAGWRGVALEDLTPYLPAADPLDPLLESRYPEPKDGKLPLPVEAEATRRKPDFWAGVMARHGFSAREQEAVTWERPAANSPGRQPAAPAGNLSMRVEILPYPGGRHPRIGFREGEIDPLRGTKASVFFPGLPGYLLVDLPEAIFSNLGLLFLAHTHVPTIWNQQNVVIENSDWEASPDGSLRNTWSLPNAVRFGASLAPRGSEVAMELWLTNGTEAPLTGLRTQICVMLKGVQALAAQTESNKIFRDGLAAVRSETGDVWVATAWDRAGRLWGNPRCPCMHSDPVLPDCQPGQTVRVNGRLWLENTVHPPQAGPTPWRAATA